MSDVDPKTQPTPKSAPAAATAPNPSQTVTVWYNETTGQFDVQPNGGTVSFTRYKDEGPDFALYLERGSNQDWEFVYWDADPKAGAPKFTPNGDPVLEVKDMRPERIEIVDRIEIPDGQTATYKHSFAIKLADGSRKPHDPEITNRREVSIGRP